MKKRRKQKRGLLDELQLFIDAITAGIKPLSDELKRGKKRDALAQFLAESLIAKPRKRKKR